MCGGVCFYTCPFIGIINLKNHQMLNFVAKNRTACRQGLFISTELRRHHAATQSSIRHVFSSNATET